MIESVRGVDIGGIGGGLSAPKRLAETEPASSGFGSSIGGALDNLGSAEKAADSAAIAGATGDLESVSDYMIAATEAQLTTEITVAVRNRAIESFNEIMRMQI